jgi:RNA polymerase sigma-70 factor (ECF subfamily)
VRVRDIRGIPGAVPSEQPAPDVGAERSRLRAAVAEAVAQLPARQRDTVVLRILEARTTRETAELMGCAEGTVKASLHQALQNLNPVLRSWRDAFVS